jgi:DNA-binding MarR family transcriptional regulator
MGAQPVEPRWLTEDEQWGWRAYLRGVRELDVALDRDLQAYDISLSEYELLSMLSEQPGGRMRMSALAELIVQSRSRVTHTANRLERRGWVCREPAPEDGRGVILVLTAQGWDEIIEMAKIHVESVRRNLLDLVSPQQFDCLGETMQCVRDGILERGPAAVAPVD